LYWILFNSTKRLEKVSGSILFLVLLNNSHFTSFYFTFLTIDLIEQGVLFCLSYILDYRLEAILNGVRIMIKTSYEEKIAELKVKGEVEIPINDYDL
jgi:hypothetical protein